MTNDANKMSKELAEIHEILKTGASLISEGCEFKGDLTLNGNAVIEGVVNGTITINNRDAVLYVSSTGMIVGEVIAATLYIDGGMNGTVHAGKITVAGKFDGDLHYRDCFVVKAGADITGTIGRDIRVEEALPANQKLSAATEESAAAQQNAAAPGSTGIEAKVLPKQDGGRGIALGSSSALPNAGANGTRQNTGAARQDRIQQRTLTPHEIEAAETEMMVGIANE